MKAFVLPLLVVSLTLLIIPSAQATHNRSGEITYEQIGELTIRATITTYTKTSSVPADRDTLELCWGDGTCTRVGRTTKIALPNDIQLNRYTATHTYPGRFRYVMSMRDPNRNGGILNVNAPFSDQVPFFLQTDVVLLNTAFQGFNSSPILLQPPIDIGYVGQPFEHTPNAYDPDGDSIAYELIAPLQDVGVPVPLYQQVTQIQPGPNNTFTFDPLTGLFRWTSPQRAGEYNIAMLVKSYRNGVYLGGIVRDIQILIKTRNNRPPWIEAPDRICVYAGDEINFEVIAGDPDVGQVVRIQATGGPFAVATSPATFTPPAPDNPVVGFFRWRTNCDHVRQQVYQVVFKAEDNTEDTIGLTVFKVVFIEVIGPPPADVQANFAGGQVRVSWQQPYQCEVSPVFRWFSVWRKLGCDSLPADPCRKGLAGTGYVKIADNVTSADAGRYFYVDNSVVSGLTYSYRVVPEFALISSGGFAYNAVSGAPSNQACVVIGRDVPLMLNVSINSTDNVSGEVLVRWSKPNADDLDTLQHPGPYRYRLLHNTGLSPTSTPTLVYQSPLRATFAAANDTSFVHNPGTAAATPVLNTAGQGHTYRVEFLHSTNQLMGTARYATSVFLTTVAADGSVILNWQTDVPWSNYNYVVHKEVPTGSGIFIPVATTGLRTWTDTGLRNGERYCYYVEALGTYNIGGLPEPLINLSQRVCAVPLDTVAPCPPVLAVSNACNDPLVPEGSLDNLLRWRLLTDGCAADVAGYHVYYAPPGSARWERIATFARPTDTLMIHQPPVGGVAGCYAVTAIDSIDVDSPVPSGGNESAFSNVVCLENCPVYELPNAFTPNGNGANDLFVPFKPYRFVSRVDFTVFGRWGERLFSTTDPELRWDGIAADGRVVPEGVYYYTCEVFENTGTGSSPARLLSGYIHLIRGQ